MRRGGGEEDFRVVGRGVRRKRDFDWFVIYVVSVYVDGSVEEGGHSCNDVVLSVDIAIREFIGAEGG